VSFSAGGAGDQESLFDLKMVLSPELLVSYKETQ
jgi:hypothetical protein